MTAAACSGETDFDASRASSLSSASNTWRAQGDDGGRRRLLRRERPGGGGDELACGRIGRELRQSGVRGDQLEIHELDAGQLADGGIDVSRQSEVDDRPARLVGDVLGGHRVGVRARDDDVGGGDGITEVALGAHPVLLGELLGAAGQRVHRELGHPEVAQSRDGGRGVVARAHDQRPSLPPVRQAGARQLQRELHERPAGLAERRGGADVARDLRGALECRVELRGRRPRSRGRLHRHAGPGRRSPPRRRRSIRGPRSPRTGGAGPVHRPARRRARGARRGAARRPRRACAASASAMLVSAPGGDVEVCLDPVAGRDQHGSPRTPVGQQGRRGAAVAPSERRPSRSKSAVR